MKWLERFTGNEWVRRPKRLDCLVIGGSNSMIKGGYIDWITEDLRKFVGNGNVFVTNTSVGGNTTVFGLQTVMNYGDISKFDLFFVEFAVNDSVLISGTPFQTWQASFESLIRLILERGNKRSRIVVVLLGRRDSRFFRLQTEKAEFVWKLANHYGFECIDIDAFLKEKLRLTGEDFSALYADPGHYKRPLVANFIASRAMIALLLNDQRCPRAARLPEPLCEWSFKNLHFTNLRGRGEEAVFENSRYRFQAIALPVGTGLEVELPASLLMISYISVPGSPSLIVSEDGYEAFSFHTLNKRVKSGRFPFLFRTIVMDRKDWRDGSHAGSRRLRIDAVAAPDLPPEITFRPRWGMIAEEPSDDAPAYLFGLLTTSVEAG